jgi:hypothetical protein
MLSSEQELQRLDQQVRLLVGAPPEEQALDEWGRRFLVLSKALQVMQCKAVHLTF